MPRAPIASGRRAPVDSPTTTSGIPRSVAVRFMWPTFLPLVALVEAPFTVKSLTRTATSRPSIRAKPAILPSVCVSASCSGYTPDAPNNPDSMKLPASTNAATRSRAFSCPAFFRRASLSAPPMPSARARRASYSSSSFSNAIVWSWLSFYGCMPAPRIAGGRAAVLSGAKAFLMTFGASTQSIFRNA